MITFIHKLRNKVLKKFLIPVHELFRIYYLLSIYSFLKVRNNGEYCMIKKNIHFPNLALGSDIDIYLNSSNKFIEDLLKSFDNKVFLKYKYFTKSENKIHIDLVLGKKLIIKLDLHLTYLENLYLRKDNNLLLDTIATSKEFEFKYFRKYFNVTIPSIEYDHLIRYVELTLYPSKVHHEEHLKNLSVQDKYNLDNFIKKYTDIENTL